MLNLDVSDQATAAIAAAEALGPLIAEHRAALARGPDLPPEIVQALEQAGLTRLWLPRALGGVELSMTDYLRVSEILARHDGSVAWCIAIATSGSRLAGMLPTETARALYGDKGFLCGSLNPTGTAVAEKSGWRVNGRWPWGSFIRYSRVTAVMCIENENGTPVLTPEGAPRLRFAFVPTEKVTILDTWDSSGLRSTGSHDFAIEDIFVPAEHTIEFSNLGLKPHQPGPLYQLPSMALFAFTLTTIGLGIARASIDALVTLAKSKIPTGGRAQLRERPDIQLDVVRGEALLRSARAFLVEATESFWETGLAGGTPTLEQRALLRMAGWNAVKTAKRVVGLMFSAAGGTAVGERAAFAAQMRDIQALGQHAVLGTPYMQIAGRILLDMEADTTRF
jgi:indole-3-acetate monooxygenase